MRQFTNRPHEHHCHCWAAAMTRDAMRENFLARRVLLFQKLQPRVDDRIWDKIHIVRIY